MAFEPKEEHIRLLNESIALQPSSDIRISVQQSFVGSHVGPGTTTLDAVDWKFVDAAARGNTLVKIDVEGAELEVLSGARSWLSLSNLFVIEVHEAAFLKSIAELFAARGLRLNQIDQRPLPFVGAEMRDMTNWWLVSELGKT